MEIMKLNQFLNEAKIYLPIVDIVIDNDGNIYDGKTVNDVDVCLLYTSPSPRDRQKSRMPSSA